MGGFCFDLKHFCVVLWKQLLRSFRIAIIHAYLGMKERASFDILVGDVLPEREKNSRLHKHPEVICRGMTCMTKENQPQELATLVISALIRITKIVQYFTVLKYFI